jgi:hypothetical protein
MKINLAIGTKKSAFILSGDRKNWKLSEPILFGNIIYHMVPDPRKPNKILIATKTGHLGPTIFRSEDAGLTWKESSNPPKFAKDTESENPKIVDFVFWLTPGHASEPNVWYAGTSPRGLFKSEDGGITWDPVDSFNNNKLIKEVTKEGGTPIGPLLHSINVDPRDKDHVCLAMSSGGFFETKDGGKTWRTFNKNVRADFYPDPYPEWGHCIHNLQLHPKNPDLAYQQNHCGIYKINFATDDKWERIGDNMPKEIGDIGFPLILHPKDENKLWVVPMDGTDVWPRTSVSGKPAVYHSQDSGKTWIRQDKGLPDKNAWFTVLRQATTHDSQEPLGLYVGNRAGEVWASFDEGESWQCIVSHLPDIYSLAVF